MKSIRIALYLTALALAAFLFALAPSVHMFIACALCLFVIGNALAPQSKQLCVTFSTTVLLGDVMETLKVRFPMLFGQSGFATDFSGDPLMRKDDVVIAKIRVLPTVADYDAATGYENGATEASSLLIDVPVTCNQHKHVPVKVDYLDQIASRVDLYDGQVNEMGFVLGKHVVDFALGKVLAANFSYGRNTTKQNFNKDTLDAATAKLNTNGASPIGRFGIVNTDSYNGLEGDSRIASGDYHGQQRTSNAYGALKNISGFENVWEYPSLPANGEQLNGFFGVRQSIVVVSRLPMDVEKIARRSGIPKIANFYSLTEPNSGLTLMGIEWQKAGVFDIYLTVVLLFGASAGRQGGAAGSICDKAGYRVTEAAGAY